ncbi:DnaA regulatory inactivator Hda [Aquabacterium sp. J223]|uniref:DnaA regulatory inactivator Hda n=1 Tax=Aquabacterium sp. J223 TaxID=2898431 RepID=UPI0021AE2F65|nr:DnaA regulatory inactivator Hda [Aquabacterium sp. J223]UUX97657.1 DnaA regulatory inactivator Hda [Aquabacterium sp. J223]
MKQIPLAIVEPAQPDFDHFLVGANAAALQHLLALQPGAAPVYLWGPEGSGKTHLLHALAAEQRRRGAQVGSFDARTPLPWTLDEGWAALLLDDCDAFDADRQQAAFSLFVQAHPAGVLIAAAGRLPPVDLPVRDDLRTRLGWGHVFALAPLAEDEARAALRREADRRGVLLADEVIDYLLTRFSRDLKHLMLLLDRMDRFALSQQRPLTVPLLRRMLAEEGL